MRINNFTPFRELVVPSSATTFIAVVFDTAAAAEEALPTVHDLVSLHWTLGRLHP